jgi:ABC-type antimicrobial peptide transport system permease subunit
LYCDNLHHHFYQLGLADFFQCIAGIPIAINWLGILLLVPGMSALVMIGAVLPARLAAYIRPASILKYE